MQAEEKALKLCKPRELFQRRVGVERTVGERSEDRPGKRKFFQAAETGEPGEIRGIDGGAGEIDGGQAERPRRESGQVADGMALAVDRDAAALA